MTAVEVEQRFTLEEALRILRDPTLNRDYQRVTRLGPVIRDYLAWKRLSNAADRTLDTYERDLALLAVKAPHAGIDSIGVAELMLVLDEIPRGSWKRYRAAWNGLFKWAIRFGHRTTINPVELLPELLRQSTTPVYKVFTAAERAAIINAARLMDDPARDRVRAHLLLDAGLRKSEAMALLGSDIDPTGRCVIVRKGKGDKQRLVSIRGDFWQAWEQHLLTPYPRLERDPLLADHVFFPMRVAGAYRDRIRQVTAAYPERPMSPRGFHEWWVRLLNHAGVEYRKPHMTRHTFATDSLDATGGDLYGVAEQLGHASTKTTEIYLHSSRRRMESVAERLARYRRNEEE